jgi:hypothetical protein
MGYKTPEKRILASFAGICTICEYIPVVNTTKKRTAIFLKIDLKNIEFFICVCFLICKY